MLIAVLVGKYFTRIAHIKGPVGTVASAQCPCSIWTQLEKAKQTKKCDWKSIKELTALRERIRESHFLSPGSESGSLDSWRRGIRTKCSLPLCLGWNWTLGGDQSCHKGWFLLQTVMCSPEDKEVSVDDWHVAWGHRIDKQIHTLYVFCYTFLALIFLTQSPLKSCKRYVIVFHGTEGKRVNWN